MADSHANITRVDIIMIKNIKVDLSRKSYLILSGENAIDLLPGLINKTKIGRDAIVITTTNILNLHGEKFKKQLKKACHHILWLTVKDSEKSKSASVALDLIKKITQFDIKKDVFLIAFGGGVIGDLTGFIAAIYKRGIPYIHIPTTLLAQVDSSIGGKTALDTKFGKNLIGAFYQPKFVIADTMFLKTLPKNEILAGLAEVIKYAAIKDQQFFSFLEKNLEKILTLDPKILEHIITVCASIKADIVSKDEFDKKGIRIILNFGHTIAHAIEFITKFRISHGDAVSIGMIYACRLSREIKLLNKKDTGRIIDLIKIAGLPSKMPRINSQAILKAMDFDKKTKKGKLRFVLLKKLGKTKIVENVSQKTILKILKQPL